LKELYLSSKRGRPDLEKDGELNRVAQSIFEALSRIIVGKRGVLENVFLAILSNGHLLFEDYPGLAKTLIARSFAQAMGCRFKRVQFTPDLLPADITGSYVLNRSSSQFELRRGPIFTNILLADEINRAPPRTQSALLEAMQERQVTVESETMKLESPFIVLATQNPIEYEGTYPLPEAQLDRFIMKIDVGYPSAIDEVEILERRIQRKVDDVIVESIANPVLLTEMQKAVEDVHVEGDVLRYIVEIVNRTREHPGVEVGSSPRGSLALMKLSRARAWLQSRSFVLPDDVKAVTVPALSHRLILNPEQWLKGAKSASNIINEVLAKTPVPKVD
jgi:MoxR-like ATPase